MIEEKDKYYGFCKFLLFVILIVSAFVAVWIVSPDSEYEYTIVDSEIVNIQEILDDKGRIEYLNVTFNESSYNQTYKIRVYDDVDLTVHSKLIVELKRYKYRESRIINEWKYSEYYTISRIIKVPI